jgi:hypothetical protein
MAIAIIALVVSALGLVVAGLSYLQSRRSVTAAEASATAARRSADAAERSAEVEAEALALEHQRDADRRIEQSRRQAAHEWELANAGEAGYFRSSPAELRGALRNVGLQPIKLRAAYLEHNGQRFHVDTRSDGPNGGGGWQSYPTVLPQTVLDLRADLSPHGLQGNAQPILVLEYHDGTTHPGIAGVTIDLGRSGATDSGERQWRMGTVRAISTP